MKIAIGSDHAGYALKQQIIAYLTSENIDFKDYGCSSEDSVDYPDFAHPVSFVVEKKEVDFGILICGSGNGINMTANKHQGIRAALCWNAEIAKLARQHNDANIVSIPARFLDTNEALEIVNTFLNQSFEGGRHANRVAKISC